MTTIPTRFAPYPTWCPRCGNQIDTGQLLAEVKIGTTLTTGCFDCHWDQWEPPQPEEAP